ncbi:MAG TPA: SDR family NAD(P)-dependent oxidoreductase, partial [Thermomicrobiales bacterium]|nr:SDR family NAD(P)-dependent oxidoreductase [Thermomicrobiales bacterium]
MDDGSITTPFGATTTAMEVVADVDLRGKRAIVTGGASGIGLETARALASAGAEVTIGVRNLEAGMKAAAGIAPAVGEGRVLVMPLDLADRAAIAAFVASWEDPLDILVNNAGIMASPEMRTAEG